MYEQISGNTLYLMFYAGVAVLNLIACCYLLFRRANAIAPDVTSPVRLRRWTAAFFAASALSHLWNLPMYFLTSSDDVMLSYLVGGLLDCMTIGPLAIVVLLTMLQDRRRPLWPVAITIAPFVLIMAWCVASRSDALLPALYVYFPLFGIGLIIYMVRVVKQYGRWLRDNYADLEQKEVWQSFVVLAFILLSLGIYTYTTEGLVLECVIQLADVVLVCYLLWRVETLSELIVSQEQDLPADLDHPDMDESDENQIDYTDNIEPLLQQYCIDAQLYLQHDLTLPQLAQAIGSNRFYLSKYFSNKGMNYNTYINDLRINHFVSLYREAVAAHRFFTIQELANASGYRSYSTFNLAFKQRMGHAVNIWAKLQKSQ